MQLRNLLAYSLVLCLLLPFTAQATTIRPFANLGEMAKASDAVVLAKALRNYTVDQAGNTYFHTSLQVIENIKGTLEFEEQFAVQNYHLKVGDLERQIWGDLELQEGITYLLFLDHIDNELWRAQMLSYAAFEEHSRNGEKLLVPFDLGTEVHIHESPNGNSAEPLGVFKSQKLCNMLRNVVQATQSWDRSLAISDYDAHSFSAGFRGVTPGHCSYVIGGTNPSRWPNFETTDLPIRYQQDGDPGCATTAAEVAAAISNINTNYTGVNVTNAGTHSFEPDCVTGATGSEFTDFLDDNHGGTRNIAIQFDDPCSEITDLTGCSGTLAIGGLYTFSSTHTVDGMAWRNAAYGYVVVNNGTGACQCGSTDYEIMMTHELSHSLNIGHISGSGTANMNPSCCNGISALDVECVDFIYAPAALPVEVIDFKGAVQKKSIALEWTSSSESNNDFYSLERRSKDGTWAAIGKVTGAGNSFVANDYEFLDESPLIGTNYYRLSQSDFDGSTTIVESIAIDYYDAMTVSIQPNPLTDSWLRSTIATDTKGAALLEVYDLTGALVWSKEEMLDRGEHQLEWNMEALSNGLYLFKITQNERSQILRFVKS